MRPRRLSEGGEQCSREWVLHHLPLGVPLHGEREAGGTAHAETLDQAEAMEKKLEAMGFADAFKVRVEAPR